MVRALLDGSKTQTRRVVKPQHLKFFDQSAADMLGTWSNRPMPYGQPGDRLWVREAWRTYRGNDKTLPRDLTTAHKIWFEADGKAPNLAAGKLRPGMFMPRWASRITLEITGVRVERLQDISESDALAEGVKNSLHLPGGRFAKENYEHLWWTIHGDGSWEANPWVWVIEFKKADQ
jgi:hypothetical protein